jgi:hypothetical protein
MSNQLQRYVLREYPQLYFAIAAAIVVAKVLGVPPTGFISWPIVLVVVAASCVFGVLGIRAKAERAKLEG